MTFYQRKSMITPRQEQYCLWCEKKMLKDTKPIVVLICKAIRRKTGSFHPFKFGSLGTKGSNYSKRQL